MDSDSLAEFNTLKAAANLACYPASVKLAHRQDLAAVTVAFGEVSNAGALHESGRFVDTERRATCLFPVASLPGAADLAAGHILVHQGTGERWRILDPVVRHPLEPVLRLALLAVRT